MDKYDIIIQAGQSNAEGFGIGPDRAEYVANPNVLYLEAEKTVTPLPVSVAVEFADTPYQIQEADYRMGEQGKIGDFALSFANEYVKNGYLEEGRKLLIVRAAVGGTGYKTGQWGEGNILEEKMFELTDYALGLNPGNRVVAFLWHQGETEVLAQNEPERFGEQFKRTLQRVRAAYGKDFPILAGEFTEKFVEKYPEYSAKILPVLKDTVNGMENAATVGTKWLFSNEDAVKNGDFYHFSREALRFLGARYFYVFEQLREGKGGDFSFLSYGISGPQLA